MLRGLSCTLARTRTPFRKVTISAVLPRPSPGKLHMNMRTGRARRGVKLFIEGKLEATLGSATEHLRRISWIGNVGGLSAAMGCSGFVLSYHFRSRSKYERSSTAILQTGQFTIQGGRGRQWRNMPRNGTLQLIQT